MTLLYAGKVIEDGKTRDLLTAPKHAYTSALIAAGPRYDRPDAGLEPVPEAVFRNCALKSASPRGECEMSDLLFEAKGIEVTYGASKGLFGRGRTGVRVLHGVDVSIRRGETVGIVGESGSGKTTLGRALLKLVPVSAGTIRFDGQDITGLSPEAMRPLRRRMQMIFQDPMASLNPRHTIRRILTEPLSCMVLRATAATPSVRCVPFLTACHCCRDAGTRAA